MKYNFLIVIATVFTIFLNFIKTENQLQQQENQNVTISFKNFSISEIDVSDNNDTLIINENFNTSSVKNDEDNKDNTSSNDDAKDDDANENYRLPNTTIPISYDINILTEIHRNVFNFSGLVKIHIKILQSTNSIVLHAKKLNNFQIKLTSYNGVNNNNDNFVLPSINYTYNNKTELLTIYSENEVLDLKVNDEYLLEISYDGQLRNDEAGFFKEYYKNWEDEKVWIASTQFEATDARHAFPCYDEPALKAKFLLSITHGNNFSAISNMPISSITQLDNNLTMTKFDETPLMSTYLIAFVVSNFHNISNYNDENNFTQSIYSRPEAINDCNFALDTSLKILKKTENYFNVKINIPKMDHIGVPNTSSLGMENWGLIIYSEKALLLNYNESEELSFTIVTVMTHEYVHQLFGNLVTPKWWTWTWLSESFASFYGHKLSNTIFPEWNLKDYYFIYYRTRAVRFDSYDTRPMTHYVEKPSEIAKMFDWVSYYKGSDILLMFETAIGEDVFKKGIQIYLQKFQYSATEEDDLFNSLQEAANEYEVPFFSDSNDDNNNSCIIKKTMKSWTNQEGYPLLTVIRNYENNSFTISQKFFDNYDDYTTVKEKTTLNKTQLWWIPINFATASKPDFYNTSTDILMPNTENFFINENLIGKNIHNDDWIILNKQKTAFYRVNYDENNWKLIINELKNNHTTIHKYNRVQLLTDAFALFLNDELNITTYLNLISYLEYETDIIVWSKVDEMIFHMRPISKINKKFELFLHSLMRPIFNKIGYHDQLNDTYLVKRGRQTVIRIACGLDLPECIKSANDHIRNIKEIGIDIEHKRRLSIYCYGLQEASDIDFNYFFNRMLTTDCSDERKRLFASLSCTKNSLQSKKLMNSILYHKKFKNYTLKEKLNLIEEFINCKTINTTLNLIWDFYEEYKKLKSTIQSTSTKSDNPLKSVMIHLSQNVCSKMQADQLRKFINYTIENDNILLENDSEIIDENLQSSLGIIEKYEYDIPDWLENDFENTRTTTYDYDANDSYNQLDEKHTKVNEIPEMINVTTEISNEKS